MTLIIWQFSGITLTCTDTWLCIRDGEHTLRFRGMDELAVWVRVVKLLARLCNSGNTHPVTLRHGGLTLRFTTSTRGISLKLRINGAAERPLLIGDLLDSVALYEPHNDVGDSSDEIGLTPDGVSFTARGREFACVDSSLLVNLAALLRQGAVSTTEEPLPPLVAHRLTFNLTPRSGLSWSKLQLVHGYGTDLFDLARSTMIHIARHLDEVVAKRLAVEEASHTNCAGT